MRRPLVGVGVGVGVGVRVWVRARFRVRVRVRVPGLRTPSPTPSPPPGAARTAVGSRSSAPSPRTTTRSSAASSVCWALKIFSVPYTVQLATSFSCHAHTSQCCQNSASRSTLRTPRNTRHGVCQGDGHPYGQDDGRWRCKRGAVGAYQWSQVRSPHPRTLSEPVPPC